MAYLEIDAEEETLLRLWPEEEGDEDEDDDEDAADPSVVFPRLWDAPVLSEALPPFLRLGMTGAKKWARAPARKSEGKIQVDV